MKIQGEVVRIEKDHSRSTLREKYYVVTIELRYRNHVDRGDLELKVDQNEAKAYEMGRTVEIELTPA